LANQSDIVLIDFRKNMGEENKENAENATEEEPPSNTYVIRPNFLNK